MNLFVAFSVVLALPVVLVLGGRGDEPRKERIRTTLVLLTLVTLAILRSAVATRLDSFTYDEPYHVTSGVAYARTGDFRLNPEHPPLAKLWVGAALPPSVFELPPFRPLSDKPDERRFTQEAVFKTNDPGLVQGRARAAMFLLNGLLLLSLGLAVWRQLGWATAMGTVGFLAIDPTVAAHLPVVLTDLPVALAGATALLTLTLALRTGRWIDLLAAALAMGATLGAKHSGLVAAVAALAVGLVWSMRGQRERWRPVVRTALVLVGGVVLLWGLYGFQFAESDAGHDLFNRPLAAKIDDVRTPQLRTALVLLEKARLLPRAYLWGLADVTRSGIEGRSYPVYAFGTSFLREAPAYFFPGVMLVKIPIGLSALALLGVGVLLRRREPALSWPVLTMIGFSVLFLVVLGSSSSAYAGIRHALPAVPAAALCAGIAVARAVAGQSRLFQAAAAVTIVAALASALPVIRPWEYYNELVGGPANAYRWFNDEGVDMGQRSGEVLRYYHEHLAPRGETPYLLYSMMREEAEGGGLRAHWWEFPEEIGDDSDDLSGTFLVTAADLAPSPWFDLAAFREAEPVDRFGNLFIYQGTFHIPWFRAARLATEGLYAKLVDNDLERAERALAEAVELYPQGFGMAIELGNLLARRGARDEALRAFQIALEHAPPGEPIVDELRRHLERIAEEPPESVPPLRNPWAE